MAFGGIGKTKAVRRHHKKTWLEKTAEESTDLAKDMKTDNPVVQAAIAIRTALHGGLQRS